MKKRIEPVSPPHRKARADARMFDTDRDLAPALPPPWPWQQVRAGAVDDIAMHDLGLLMDAVKARLRQLVEPNPAAPADQGLALCVRSGVDDCVDALGQLQAMTLQALGRYRQAELDALDAQADGLHARPQKS